MESAKSGFTLIEVLIVVAILSVLIVLSFGAYRTQLYKGYDGKRKADIANLKITLEEYEKDNECYPPSLNTCGASGALKPYINIIPCDPRTKLPYRYYVENVSCPKWYWIFTNLDYLDDPVISDIGCQNKCGPTDTEINYNYYSGSPNANSPSVP